MTPEFLAAVIDTLLPREGNAPSRAAPLPSGTQAGLDPADYAASGRVVFEAVAAQAGGDDLFIRADENTRIATLEAVERTAPDAFRALLATVLSDYYEAPPVLTALGWRIDPPQPAGHTVSAGDEATRGLLRPTARRERLWR